MGRLGIDDLEPGMILEADLRSPQGRLLLTKGMELTDDHLRTCKIWGVIEADIQGFTEHDAEVATFRLIDAKILEATTLLAKSRFRLANLQQEAMAELCRQFKLRTTKRLTDQEAISIIEEHKNISQDLKRNILPSLKKTLDPYKVVDREIQLCSLPDIFSKIVDAINSPRSSATYVADIIGKDPSLSAKLLRLVNSPFYGFPQEIDTLTRAVTIIGSNHLTNLALGISVLSLFNDIPPELIDMKSFWKHHLACGIISRLLAGHMSNINEERFFVAGLLHDIGRLVMIKYFPDITRESLELARKTDYPLHVIEQKLFGFNHGLLAGLLVKSWKFPQGLERAIGNHHSPQDCTTSSLDPSIVHVADVITHSLGIGSSGADSVPPLIPEAWESLGFSKSILPSIIVQLEYQFDETYKIFYEFIEEE